MCQVHGSFRLDAARVKASTSMTQNRMKYFRRRLFLKDSQLFISLALSTSKDS